MNIFSYYSELRVILESNFAKEIFIKATEISRIIISLSALFPFIIMGLLNIEDIQKEIFKIGMGYAHTNLTLIDTGLKIMGLAILINMIFFLIYSFATILAMFGIGTCFFLFYIHLLFIF